MRILVPIMADRRRHGLSVLSVTQASLAHSGCLVHGRVDWWSFGILIYELLYGFTPFRGKKRDETFNNILKRPLSFPDQPEVSEQCKVPPDGSERPCTPATLNSHMLVAPIFPAAQMCDLPASAEFMTAGVGRCISPHSMMACY